MQQNTRILIIEDDDNVREMLREFLEYAGYDVIEAPNGLAGVHLYRLAPADLIITDILMPRMNGLDAILEVRRDFPEAKIIAMSSDFGHHETDMLSVARRFGAARTVRKPFRLKEVLQAVQDVLP